MSIIIKEDEENYPLCFSEGNLEIKRIEIFHGVGVYQAVKPESLTNYCDFAIAIFSQFKKPFYLKMDGQNLFYVEEGVKACLIERFFRGLV